MMRRKLLSVIVFLCAGISLSARMPDQGFLSRFRVGVEWGYSQSLLRHWDYNYFSEEGYRVYDREQGWHLRPNGSLLAQIGYDANEHLNIALYAGYIGVGKDNRMIPIQLRLSCFPKTSLSDGLFYFLQGGAGLHVHGIGRRPAWLGSLGAGYRIVLTEGLNLDLHLALQGTLDHPLIPNPEAPGNVPESSVLKNNAAYCSLNVTAALNF